MVQGADRSKVGAMLRGALKGPLGKTLPLSAAVDSTVEGIEHRSRRVLTPGWLRAVLLVRGLLNGPATDRQTATVMPEADRVAAQEAFERGAAASAAVGAGGEADNRPRARARAWRRGRAAARRASPGIRGLGAGVTRQHPTPTAEARAAAARGTVRTSRRAGATGAVRATPPGPPIPAARPSRGPPPRHARATPRGGLNLPR